MKTTYRFFVIMCAAAIVAVGTLAIGSDTSPLMGMEIPEPGDPGPTYATNIQEALEIIDAHDHSAGKGTKVTPAGINVNVDLEMNLMDLTEVRTIRLDSTAVTIAGTDRRAIYNIGGELAYIDESGNITTITNNGSVNSAAGSIAGMGGTTAAVTYSDASDTFSFTSNTGFPAKGDFSTVRVAEHVSAGKGPILTSNAATAADYNFIFPSALPGANRVLCLNASGDLSTCTASAAAQAFVVATSTSSATMSATTSLAVKNGSGDGTIRGDIGAFTTLTVTDELFADGVIAEVSLQVGGGTSVVKIGKYSDTLNFGSITNTCEELNITTGATSVANGDGCTLDWSGARPAGSTYVCSTDATVVNVIHCCHGTCNPDSQVFTTSTIEY